MLCTCLGMGAVILQLAAALPRSACATQKWRIIVRFNMKGALASAGRDVTKAPSPKFQGATDFDNG